MGAIMVPRTLEYRASWRQRRHFGYLSVGKDLALHEGSLDVETVAQLLAVIIDDTERSDGVILSGGQRSGAVEDVVETAHPQLVQSLSGQGVLDNSVVDLVLAQLGTQCGVLRNGDSLVIDQDTCACALDAFSQSFDYRLLFAKNLCIWHIVFHLHANDDTPKKKTPASRRKGTKTITVNLDIVNVLGRIYGQDPPAVFGAP